MTKDKTQAYLFLSSGSGPVECRIALRRLLRIMEIEADQKHVDTERLSSGASPDKYGPASALFRCSGPNADEFARSFTGTIRCVFQSPVRRNHKRKNWYVAVQRVDDLMEQKNLQLTMADIKFETLRAGGPGGQHQNTTDSAVRATHIPTGITTVSRSERSQHRNKAIAIKQLEAMMGLLNANAEQGRKTALHEAHQMLERGNEIRTYRLDPYNLW